MNKILPKIGVVIIGINVARYIGACIESVRSAKYPGHLLDIVFVDGGSTDDSSLIATSFDGVKVIQLNDRHPTPGRGRNAGWRELNTRLIQFLDADTVLHPDWFVRALDGLDDETVAVCGLRSEKYPSKNLYHVLTDMEWRYETGPCRYFGGDVLVRRDVLEASQGFDEDLVAGEDPELSYRIRGLGGRILRLDQPMTTHDINMNTFGQYVKRAFRSGYAYAEIGLRFARSREKMWLRELTRISVNAVLPAMLALGGLLSGHFLPGIFLGLLFLGRPFFRLNYLRKRFGQSWKYALFYAAHASLVVYPQFGGILRYFWGKLTGQPLQNKGVPA